MRVRFQNSDGLVFLSRVKPAITLDASLLCETERLDLEQLVRAARFFDLPEQIPGNLNGGPAWYITIEDGSRRHSVKVGQPVQGPAMTRHALIAWIATLSTWCRTGETIPPSAVS